MIYTKTQSGKTEFQNKSREFTPQQRAAFILFYGTRTVADILEMTSAFDVTMADIDRLVAAGFLASSGAMASVKPTVSTPGSTSSMPVAPAKPAVPASTVSAPVSAEKAKLDEQAHYAKAYPIAVKLTSNLGIRGFRLNLSVESAGNLAQLKELAPKIQAAVGADKFKELENALYR